MKFSHIVITCFLILCPLCAWTQQVTITGNAPEYAGRTLTFFSVDNFISNTEEQIGECTVATNGDFKANFTCNDVKVIYLYLGVYKTRFYAEPGYTYEIVLPVLRDKTPEEASSPFFREIMIYLSLLSVKNEKGQTINLDDDLNMRVIHFDEQYDPVYETVITNAMMKRTTGSDSIITNFAKGFPKTTNLYFNDYATYRIGLLYYAAQLYGVKRLSQLYFSGKPLRYDNEAYMDLFNTTYDKYFMYFGRTKEGEAIYPIINSQQSFTNLKKCLSQDGVVPGDSLLELVILKNVYDEFYSDRFLRTALLKILDSLSLQTSIQKHKEMATQMRQKITKLLRGFAPPDFSLYNQDSVLVSLEHYRGKYIYLMFCTTQNYSCFGQYELLEELHKEHGKWLQIVVISADDKFDSMKEFRKKNNYAWDFLYYGNDPDVLEKYDVRMVPTYYLIAPDGTLVLSPAPAPNEDIEHYLFTELQRKGLWSKYRQEGLIEEPKNTGGRLDFNLFKD